MSINNLHPVSWRCGYCGDTVSSRAGFTTEATVGVPVFSARPCPGCDQVTFFISDAVVGPLALPGEEVQGLPEDVAALYREARGAIQARAFTGAVLIFRKLLMHMGASVGAPEGKNFVAYVEHLSTSGHLPTAAKPWLDYLRKSGNEATHELVIADEPHAVGLLDFTTIMLRVMYEMPYRVPGATPS